MPLASVCLAASLLGQSALPAMPGEADVDPDVVPIEVRGLDIKQNLGLPLPLDLPFRDSAGNDVRLGDYFNRDRPVLINLNYYDCPLLCPQIHNGIIQAIRDVDGLDPGVDYEILSISIDPQETPADAAAAKTDVMTRVRAPGVERGWHFLVGPETYPDRSIAPVAAAAGFDYRWLPQQQIFAHGAVILFATADGTINSYLNGVKYPAHQYRLALVDAGEGRIGSPFDQLVMWCSGFNPDAGEYTRLASRIMTLAGGVIVLLLAIIVVILFKLEKNRDRFMPDKTA